MISSQPIQSIRFTTSGGRATAYLLVIVGVLLYEVQVAAQSRSESLGTASPKHRARESTDEVTRWIQQLSASSFAKREQAAGALVQIGTPALKSLRVAFKKEDPELRLRAGVLIQDIEEADLARRIDAFLVGKSDDLAGWNYAKQIMGDVPVARELFVASIQCQPDLVAALNTAGPDLQLLANNTASQIRERLFFEMKIPQQGDLVAILLVCGNESISITGAVEKTVVRLMNSSITSQAARDKIVAPVFGRLAGVWMRRASVEYQSQALFHCMQYDFAEGVDLARNVLDEYADLELGDHFSVPSHLSERLEFALLAIAKHGDASDVKQLRALQSDARQMPFTNKSFDDKGNALIVQVRDLAIASAIHILGGDLTKAGYPKPRKHANLVFSTSSIGFPGESDQLRADAIAYLSRLSNSKPNQ